MKSNLGELEIDTHHDRYSSFGFKIIEKRQQILADILEKQIVGITALAAAYGASPPSSKMYDTEVST